MQQLIIVSTKPDGGKGGGIPSALIGYINGLNARGVSYQIIESHIEDVGIIFTWLSALWKVILLSIKYKKQATFWFHCGPWFSVLRKFSLALFPRLLGCQTIAHIHSPTFNDYLSKSFSSNCLIKFALLPFSQIVVLTPWWQSLLIKHGVNKSIAVSPNPNSARYCEIAQLCRQTPKQVAKDKTHFNILTMARLIEGKGVELVISALAKLPENYSLTIAGDGPLRQELEQQAKVLGVFDRIAFSGWIDGKQKENLFHHADIFCLPSRYDSFGMVFIEAMAFDLPVVAYDWGPIKDVVTADVGLCCLNATDDEVCENIIKISAQLHKYQGAGSKRVLKCYTPRIVTNNIINILK